LTEEHQRKIASLLPQFIKKRLSRCSQKAGGQKKKAKTVKAAKLCSQCDVEACCKTLCKPHCTNQCREFFNNDVGITATTKWRTAFYSLAKRRRMQHLVEFFRVAMLTSGMVALAAGDSLRDSGFQMQYTFLGKAVCRATFASLVGLSIGVLVKASQFAAIHLHNREAELVDIPRDPSKMAQTIGDKVALWLKTTALRQADISPIHGTVFLAIGYRYILWVVYIKTMMNFGFEYGQLSSLKYFLEVRKQVRILY